MNTELFTLEEALCKPLIIDGGMGSELERNGCNVSDSLWSGRVLLESPSEIARVHRAYLEAGAQVLITASYQVSYSGFAQKGISPEMTESALKRSIEIARDVRDEFYADTGEFALVAASVGPYGAALADGSEFHGNYAIGVSELIDFHRQRMKVLASSGPDLLACETIPSLGEAQAILTCLKEFSDTKAWFSFSCQDERHIAHGEEIRACARLLNCEPQVVAVGVNCTPPRLITSLIEELRTETQKPIVIYPNAGRTWDAASRGWRGGSDLEHFAELGRKWRASGASWIGGCCGTTPSDIATLRQSRAIS